MAIFNTIKLNLDCKNQHSAVVEKNTFKTVSFWLNNNLKFHLSLFCDGSPFKLNQANFLCLGIKHCIALGEGISESFDILKKIDVSKLDSNTVEIEILPSDISATMQAGTKWLVVYAVDSHGGVLTFFGGVIFCKNDASDVDATGAEILTISKVLESAQNIETLAEQISINAELVDSLSKQVYDKTEIVSEKTQLVVEKAQLSEELATNAQESAIQASESEANAEYWARQAQAISDPENRIGTLAGQVSTLQTGKTDKGSLHFNGGVLSIGKSSNSEAYSHCFTMSYSYEDYLNISVGSTIVGTTMYDQDSYNGWFLLNNRTSTKERITFFSFNKIEKGDVCYIDVAYGAGIKDFFDGTPKKFVVVRDSVNTRLFVDNVLKTTRSVPANGPDLFFKVGYKAGSFASFTPFFKGKVSDVAVFNFDITAEDALYTINDYQNGKPIPPYLLDGNAYFLDSTKSNEVTGSGFSSRNTVEFIEGSGLESTITETGFNATADWTVAFINLPISIKPGDIVDFEFGQHQRIKDGGEAENISSFCANIQFYTQDSSNSLQALPSPNSNSNYRVVAILKGEEATRVGIQYSFSKSATSVKDVFPFKLKVNGAEVALENYTFNGEVLDYSGNGRHGSITGSVKGDNDTKVETLFEKISARIANQTNG